ncbi:hypothetical protein [Aquisphaera giovannonii]|uniref:hypothetical protein n=1 Tax=Aquisphaera giovannonii TaxID=406548 RepID=UPI0011DF9CA5|nr:hypothetical protein [Aquisphaera giovannonii]
MATDEVEAVLANWIEQALDPRGRLSDGISPSAWVVAQFGAWWRARIGHDVNDAEHAAFGAHDELMRLGGWAFFGEALHELTDVRDSIGDLRRVLRLHDEPVS